MPVGDFLEGLGYGAGAGVAPDPGRPFAHGSTGNYLGLYGDVRAAEFLRQQADTGLLSPESVNPFIAALVEGSAASEDFRRQNLLSSMAASGVNPAIADRLAQEGEHATRSDIASKIAGFEAERQAREYQAEESLVNLANQVEAERTARVESLRRFHEQSKASASAQRTNTLLGAGAIGASLIPYVGPLLGGLLGSQQQAPATGGFTGAGPFGGVARLAQQQPPSTGGPFQGLMQSMVPPGFVSYGPLTPMGQPGQMGGMGMEMGGMSPAGQNPFQSPFFPQFPWQYFPQQPSFQP